ncbi:unnamed protein product [Blepharisma stoltei]|uniref:Uncharacterized protein n=1 Tax=Blepharisma stoltei TaxID=1481888 RepID=A0AAU9IKX8_9CILI|nr:unnamed protein product [Blepharisma stoltei]
MLDFIDLQVIRIEGIEYDPADLSVSLITDSKCIGKVYPLSQANEMNPIRIPSLCYLQFVTKIVSHQEQIISSVTLQTQILPKEGYQWVPLFQCSNDLIYSFPKEIGPIKLLIYIKSKRPLSPVQEITENSEQGSEINSSMTFREETMPELKFSNGSIDEKEREEKQAYYSLRIIELEQTIQRDRFNFNEELIRSGQEYKKAIDQISIELEIYKAKSKNFQKLIDEFKEENEELRAKLEQEKEKTNAAEENLQKNILKSKMSENSLLKILEKKDADLFDLRDQIKVLKNENQELQDRNKIIQNQKCSVQTKLSPSLKNSGTKSNKENTQKKIALMSQKNQSKLKMTLIKH